MNDRSESAQSDLTQVLCNWAAQEKFQVHSVILNVTFPVGSSSEKSANWHVNTTAKSGEYTQPQYFLSFTFLLAYLLEVLIFITIKNF